jgi:hypothetical protein
MTGKQGVLDEKFTAHRHHTMYQIMTVTVIIIIASGESRVIHMRRPFSLALPNDSLKRMHRKRAMNDGANFSNVKVPTHMSSCPMYHRVLHAVLARFFLLKNTTPV